MKKILLTLGLMLVLLAFWDTAKAQEPEQSPDSDLYVTVLYDPDGDGQDEGVGGGIPVYIRESGSNQIYAGFTQEGTSTASFKVFQRTYIIEAYPPQTKLFYIWVCQTSRNVDSTTEFVILRCVEQFFMRIPIIHGFN